MNDLVLGVWIPGDLALTCLYGAPTESTRTLEVAIRKELAFACRTGTKQVAC